MARDLRVLLAALVAALACETAHAALPGPPFELSVAPGRIVEGGTATIEIRAAGRAPDDARYDIYLVWALGERAIFLTPESSWSAQPVPYHRAASPSAFSPAPTPWRAVGPVADVPLAMVVVPSGVHPMDRERWTFRPVLRWVTVQPRARARAPVPIPLAAAAAAVSALLFVGPGLVEWIARRGSTGSQPTR